MKLGSGQVAVVTGAASGLGLATAAALRPAGPPPRLQSCDVADAAAVSALAAA